MIIKVLNGNSIIKWKYNDKDKWKYAEISDLIKAYERPQDCSDCKRYDSPYFEVKFDKEQMQELVDKAKSEVLASIERPQGEWIESHICSCGKILRMGMDVIEHKCKNCGRWSIKWARTIPDSFCSNCGAKIKKGGAE